MSEGTPRAYREDIQFLRGVAIVAVLCFHLQPHLLPAGFVGVDLFFVLSGFLMGSLYDMERMSAIEFYLRRAKRILPAYFAAVTITVTAASLIVLPHEFADITASALFASALAGNVGPWLHASYFDKSYFDPLLHLWSLGVETQFYVLFPLMAWVWRRRPWLVILATAASLGACIVLTGISAKTSFFLTPFRLWEFAAGFFAAKWLAPHPGFERALAGHRWLGVAALLVVMAITFLKIPETQHPGLGAVAVTVATVAILVSGLPAGLLRSPLGGAGVWLGKYSYSIYLVHFPVIALYLYVPFGGGLLRAPSVAETFLLIGVTLAGALAMYHLVEQPCRQIRSPTLYWRVQGAAMVVVVAGVLLLPIVQGQRFTAQQRVIFAAWADRSEYRCGKLARIVTPAARSCALTTGPKGAPSLLLVGNSHADSLKSAFAQSAAAHGVTLRLMVANCALGEGDCRPELVAREAIATQSRTVIVHSSPGSTAAQSVGALVRAGQLAGFVVVLIEPVPVWVSSVPRALYEASATRGPLNLRQSLADYQAYNASFLNAVDAIQANNFLRVETAPLFCRPNCALADDRTGAPFYFDSGHLTLTGARRLTPIFDEIITSARRDGFLPART